MSDTPAPRDLPELELADWAGRKRARAKSENTQRAYRHHWAKFEEWCASSRRNALPAKPETIVAYLKALEEQGSLAASSVSVRLAAIAHAHRTAGYNAPTDDGRVCEVWAGFQREHGRPPRRAWALETSQIKAMLAECPQDLGGDRDAALILVGFAGGLRRSELVRLNVEDIAWTERGAALTLQRGKNDSVNKGRLVAIPYLTPATCPARHLAAWIKRAKIRSGAVFRGVDRSGYRLTSERISAVAIVDIIKRLAEAIGLDPAHYSGHSLRAGFVTAARRGKADAVSIARSTGHKDLKMIGEYSRPQDLYDDCAAFSIGL